MRSICLAVLLATQVFSQVEKTAEQLEAEKRDPKKKAAVLLDNAGQAVGTARPEVHPPSRQIARVTSVGSCKRKSSGVSRR